MTIESEITALFNEESTRYFEKEIAGFYISESQYQGTNIFDEI